MKIYPLKNEEGKLHAFEIANFSTNRKKVTQIIKGIPNVILLKTPKPFSWFREDEFCKFKLGEREFTIEEPFGDNSRYLIGAIPPGWCPEIDVIESIFSEA